MGTITRHAGAPFVNGEVLDGDDLEFDIDAIVTELNGNIDGDNFKTDANVSGSKIQADSLTATQFTNSTITTAVMAAAGLPKHAVSVVSSYGTLSGSASLRDFSGLTAATLTPGSIMDMIFMDIAFDISAAGNPPVAGLFGLGWHVNGTDYDNVMSRSIPELPSHKFTLYSSYSVLAPSAASMTIKPRYKSDNSKTITVVGDVTFRCFILPGK